MMIVGLDRTLRLGSLSVLQKPLLFLAFFYFVISPADLLYIHLLLFKVKLTNAFAFAFALILLCIRPFQFTRPMLLLLVAFLSSMLLSLSNSPNLVASFGFLLFFLFNYLFYFSTAQNLFRFIEPNLLLKVYQYSFYATGIYALCQIAFSLIGINLPGVNQYIYFIARGAAFSSEPSFYALYMTPFAIFCTTRFILQDPLSRKTKEIFWPNLLLLISTSTGCFFSYLFFLLLFTLAKKTGVIEAKIKTIMLKLAAYVASIFLIISIISKELITSGLLKFFYGSKASHFSVQDRWRGLVEYWDIFLEYPLFGVSFGGGPFYLANKHHNIGANLLDPSILAKYSPMNATTEVLASLGIVGAICFCAFFYHLAILFQSAIRNEKLSSEERINLISLGLSLGVMFMTLQFNQSIMRAYMWIHVGIVYGYTKYLIDKTLIQRRSLTPL